MGAPSGSWVAWANPGCPDRLRKVPLRLAANLSQPGLSAGILAKNTPVSEACLLLQPPQSPLLMAGTTNVPFNFHTRGQQQGPLDR